MTGYYVQNPVTEHLRHDIVFYIIVLFILYGVANCRDVVQCTKCDYNWEGGGGGHEAVPPPSNGVV